MKMFNSNKVVLLIMAAALFASCNKSSKSTSSLTGWEYNNPKYGGFQTNSNYKEQGPPPGMVLIEGGTYTMGSVQDDVMFDWNTTPVKQQVRSFYMDEAEVTNREYVFYLQYLERVFPPSDDTYRKIYQSALPDTLVWRNTLGFNELLTENYLRHPAYADYPVVGVSWIQATEYCKWRTDRVNEGILMKKGILNPLFEMDSLTVEGGNRFDTETYLANPNLLFNGDSTIYDKGIKDYSQKGKVDRGSFTGRHVQISDGIIQQRFRLPTETEWEYAAKALVENRVYNSIRGRKKYSWNGNTTREDSRRYKGDQLANFKQGKGDYSGLAGWSNDGADITMRIKAYKPNAFGLFDMSGNVSEWVADVYRPIIDNDANDFSYYRGNVFTKKKIDEYGNVVVVDYNTVEFDTLDNGKLIPKDLPGSIKYVPVTKRDAFMRRNYEKAYNVDSRDGDLASTSKYYSGDDEDNVKPRMYNSPKIPRQIGESGLIIQQYDTKNRTTLISDKTRVYKGGSWKDRAYWLDPAQRRYLPQYMATNYIGFRCATDKLGQMSYAKRRKEGRKSK